MALEQKSKSHIEADELSGAAADEHMPCKVDQLNLIAVEVVPFINHDPWEAE